VAILVADGFEQVEPSEPREAFDEAGAETRIAFAKDDRVRGWNFADWGRTLPGEVRLGRARDQGMIDNAAVP
jgi:protease I